MLIKLLAFVLSLRAGGSGSRLGPRNQRHVEALLEDFDLLAHADVDEEVRSRKAEAPELHLEPTVNISGLVKLHRHFSNCFESFIICKLGA
eukprot:12830239-Heterocapsa_arctica.AAC.1